MADQYMRMPEKALAFGDGTTVTQQTSLGAQTGTSRSAAADVLRQHCAPGGLLEWRA